MSNGNTFTSFDDGFEHITQDEFEIWNPQTGLIKGQEDYNWYDGVEEILVDKLTKKYGDSDFKFDTAGIGHDQLSVTAPSGKEHIIQLNSGWDGMVNPQAHKQLMDVLNSEIDPEKKKIFDATGLQPNDDGTYNIETIDEDKPTVTKKRRKFDKFDFGPDTFEKENYNQTADKDQVLDIAASMEGELTKALTSLDTDGDYVEYPGLSQRASSTRIGNLTEQNQKEIRNAVFAQVHKKHGISKDSFNDMWDRGLFNNVKSKIEKEQEFNNSIGLLSDKEKNEDFIKEQENVYHNKLKGKEADKQKLIAQITDEQNNIKNYKSQLEQADLDRDAGKIKSLKNSIEQSELNIEEYNKQIDNLAVSTKYTPRGKDGLTVDKETVVDDELGSMLFDNSGMGEERAKRIEEASNETKDGGYNPELKAIKLTNPKLSDKEAMKELWDLKVLRKQQLIKEAKDKKIKVKAGELASDFMALTKKDKTWKEFIRTAEENGLTDKDGNIEMSVYDFMTKFDQNFRDFDNWYNYGSGMISKDDLAMIEEFEAGRDYNEGQMQALYEMVFLNTDPEDIDKGGLLKTGTQAAVEAMGRDWFGMSEKDAQNMATLGDGPRAQVLMDKMNDVQYDLNEKIDQGLIEGEKFVWTKEQIQNMERTFGEEVAEGIGSFVPMLVELGVISAVSGGVGGATGLTSIMAGLRAGEHGRKGKMAYHALMAGWEEAKMQAIFDLPPTGGAMFYAGGALTQKITPFKKGGRWSWMDPAYQKLIKGGVVGATSAEAAHITEMAYDDLVGNKDFMAKFDENFGDMDENTRRWLVNSIVFGLTGVTHLKKGDLMTTGGKQRAIIDIVKEQKKITDNPEGTFPLKEVEQRGEVDLGSLSKKQREKYDALETAKNNLTQMFLRDRHNAQLDPNSKNFEANYDRMVIQPMNQAIKAVVPEYKGFKVRFTENRKEFTTDKEGRDLGNEAEFRPETNEMLIYKPTFTPGKAIHEYTHAALRAYFAKNPEAQINFTKSMDKLFGEFDFKTKRGTKLGDAILEHYGRPSGPEGKDMRTKEGKRLKNEEFLAYMAEMLSDPAIYYQKVAPTAFKEMKQELTSIMEETFGLTPKVKTVGDFVRLLGRLSQDAARGLEFKNKASRLAELDKIDFLGIEYTVAKEKRDNQALGSRNLELEKQNLVQKNIRLGKEKPEGWRTEMDKNVKQIKELNKNLEISESNAKNIAKYEQAVKEEAAMKEKPEGFINPKKERAIKALQENNKGILNEFINNNYKEVPGSPLTKSEFKNYVENNEFLKLVNTYTKRPESAKDVPFGAYLRQNLPRRTGNILKALGIDLASKMKTVSLDAPEVREMEAGKTTSVEANSAGGKKGIELIYELPVKQETIDAIREKVSDLNIEKLDYKTLKDQAAGATKEMFGKSTKDKAKFIVDNWKTIYDLLPQNTSPITGKATGIENSILKDFYSKGKRVKMAETGDKAGNPIQEKISMDKNTFLDKLGIKETKDGVDVSGMNRNIKTSTIPAIINQTGKAITNQIVRQTIKDKKIEDAANVLNRIGAGKSKALASKNLEGKSFEDQIKVLNAIQDKNFAALLDRNLKIDPEKAISRSLVDYFGLKKDKDFGINNKDLNTIGAELGKEFTYGKITPLKVASKAARSIELPNELSNIEAKYGLQKLSSGSTFDNVGDIVAGQALDRKLATYLTKKYGVGAYENIMLNATSSGGGIGAFREVVDMMVGKKHRNRYAIWRSANERSRQEMDVYDMLDSVYAELGGKNKLKKFEGMTREESNRQGENKKLMKIITDSKGEFSVEKAKKEYEFGEKNKELLIETAEQVADLYDKKLIDHRQVRQWVEMHAGSMQGLIKKAASLAVLPEGKKRELEKIYGKDWVLEHTTPAKYVKARIYDYILSGGKDAKIRDNMLLTIKDMHTTFIPETLDKMVNKTLQENLPSNHVPGMDPLFSRYYLASHPANFGLNLKNFITGKEYKSSGDLSVKEAQVMAKNLRDYNLNLMPKEFKALASKDINSRIQERLKNIERATRLGKKKKKKVQGMSTFDFDETLIDKGENFIVAREPNTGKKVKISSGNWPIEGPKFAEQGYTFDFKDFVNVRGGVEGPLLQKLRNRIEKYGPKNNFILTARPPESATAIYGWLKSKGINIPFENITGLGNSTGEAKALWMLEKFGQGYNDMYFVDDALPNVKAVKKVLDQLDIKSNVQQVLASRDLNLDFNKILEAKTGVPYNYEYKAVTARMQGKNKGKWQFILPPSASDFELLTHYTFSGKGKKGEADMKFFDEHLSKPFAKGINAINTAKQKTTEDYMSLRKQMPKARKMLNKKVPGTKFTHDAAIRVDRWTKAGFEVPGLNKKDLKILNEVVNNNADLKAYSEALGKISKQKEGWIPPTEHWLTENITADLNNINNKVNRSKYLAEWIENKNIIFSEKNLNKIESQFGTRHREALEDMLYRMETGSNRTQGTNRLTNSFMNWTNNSVGAIMFFNMRSAELQMLSSVNYINWKENNPAKAALAFANQPQYWKDFSTLFNSDMLKQRRAGLKMNVNEAEIAAAVENSRNKAASALDYLLKKGFLPTQIADSFAIASGGATFYRNRIKMYEKQGLSKEKAESNAFRDFQEIAEKTQQSSRPDLISQQQASPLGRLILAFANTPMQYARIMKKSSMDLASGRGDAKSHISRIAFYGAIQSMIFAGLQSGSFAMLFDDELAEDEEFKAKRWDYMLSGMTDGLLRGTGVGGASVAALKNGVNTFMEENKKDWNADYDNVWIDLLNISPPIGSKVRKLKQAGNTWQWNKEVIPRMGWDIDNPGLHAAANVVSATTNAPLDRFFMKLDNLRGAADVNNENWQRLAMFGGYSRWSLGMDRPDKVEKIKEEIKEEKKTAREEKRKIEKALKKKEIEEENQKKIEENQKKSKEDGLCSAISKNGNRCRSKAVRGGFCTVHEKVEQNIMGGKSQCKKVKSNGKRCKMQTSAKSGYCYYHD